VKRSNVAKIPESITQRLGATFTKVRQVNPGQAKTSAARGTASVKETATLVVGYVKQETLGPLKNVGKFLAFGVASAVLSGFGLVLITLGILRLFQRLSAGNGHLSGSLNFLPYVLTVIVAFVLIGLVFVLGRRGPKAGSNS
jgi:hypothetical protein